MRDTLFLVLAQQRHNCFQRHIGADGRLQFMLPVGIHGSSCLVGVEEAPRPVSRQLSHNLLWISGHFLTSFAIIYLPTASSPSTIDGDEPLNEALFTERPLGPLFGKMGHDPTTTLLRLPGLAGTEAASRRSPF
jgi:hypothetical protein